MKLNNGRYAIDTDEATKIAVGELVKEGNAYSYETEKRFTLWKSNRSGKYFITMHYREFIGCFFKRRGAEGDTLVDVYDGGGGTLAEAMWRYKIEPPVEALESV